MGPRGTGGGEARASAITSRTGRRERSTGHVDGNVGETGVIK